MLGRDCSRSTLSLLSAAMLMLASITPALGQAVPTPTPQQPGTGAGAQAVQSPAPIVNAPSQDNTSAQNSTSAQNNAPSLETGSLLAYSLASVPDMIGDTPSNGHYTIGFFGRYPATVPIAGGNLYGKIADDTSPIPTDRVFFDYNFYNHAVQTANGAMINLNSYSFGVEKTFFDGRCSIEIQTPFDTGLNNNQILGGTTAENEGTVFGDATVTLKCLIYNRNCFAVSIGTMVDLPTAQNGVFHSGIDTLTIENRSVHVAPFVGFAYAPCCGNFFAIGFVQADVDANGDPVNENVISTDPTIGRLRDPSLLYVDLSMGYWLLREDDLCCRYLTGVAPVVELHYTTTLQNYHGVDDAIFPIYGGTDCLDLTAGVHFKMGPCSMLTVAGVVPLMTSPRDKEFDSELAVQFDRRF
jgi:hypothetical protein